MRPFLSLRNISVPAVAGGKKPGFSFPKEMVVSDSVLPVFE
jgi:hypothetical protein